MSIHPGTKILLVEDANVMRKMEIKTLQSLGFENIIEAVDGGDAIDKLQQHGDIELVISDWNMPNKNGYDLLVWLRAHEQFNAVPFLMATGRGEKREVESAKQAGVSSFISKPFNAAELREKIDEAFGFKKTEETSDVRKSDRILANGKVRISVAHIQITDHLVLGVLKHLIQTEKLSPRYFELETTCMAGWNPVAAALEKDQVDGACVLAPIAMDLFGFGVPIKLILLAHKNGSICVRNKQGGEYREPYADFFRNKVFYIPHMLSVHHMLAHLFFEGIGLNPGVSGTEGVNVNLEVVPPVKMPEFLSTNPNACGFLVAEPLGTKAIAAGIAELQFLSSELWENHPCCVVAMQREFIDSFPDATAEFTKMLVQAGKFIQEKPGQAAEIAVNFLDPDRSLGLRVPLLKNVLTEPMGIKTGDLYPVKEDLDRIQRFMSERMGVGRIIDLDEFVDLRFADQACTDRVSSLRQSILHDVGETAIGLMNRAGVQVEGSKSLLNKEGKYLSFLLGEQQFGIDILKIREIIRLIPIRSIPKSPPFVKGIIDLRGKVIPVIDLRTVFGMPPVELMGKHCIIVLEIETVGKVLMAGVIVDGVSEVANIEAKDIEETPSIGMGIDMAYLLGIAKTPKGIQILLDIDRVLDTRQTRIVEHAVELEAA